MQNRMTSRRRPLPATKPGTRGDTASSKEGNQGRAPRAPHERDESADSQSTGEASAPRMGRMAAEDVERGVVDTDKGPVLDQVYDKVREGADDPTKKLSP